MKKVLILIPLIVTSFQISAQSAGIPEIKMVQAEV